MEQQILQRLKRPLVFMVLLALGLAACSSKKSATAQNKLEFSNVSAHIKKVFPGVSGEVIYFLQYRVEMDVRTDVEVQFKNLLIGESEVVINSVSIGNKILNTNLGEHLSESAENVTLKGTHPVYQKDRNDSTVTQLGQPGKMTLQYMVDGTLHSLEISEVFEEPNEYRPAAHPGQRD